MQYIVYNKINKSMKLQYPKEQDSVNIFLIICGKQHATERELHKSLFFKLVLF